MLDKILQELRDLEYTIDRGGENLFETTKQLKSLVSIVSDLTGFLYRKEFEPINGRKKGEVGHE